MYTKNKDLIHLGFSNRPHGIKGGFLFRLFNSEDSVLKQNSDIILFPKDKSSSLNEEGEKFQISNIHFGPKTICYLAEVKDRNRVEAMLPFDIYFPRKNFPKLRDDEVYLTDLIGLTVISQTGQKLGVVETQYNNGAQAVLKLKLSHNSIELPFVKNFFPNVDLVNKTITLIEPEVEE